MKSFTLAQAGSFAQAAEGLVHPKFSLPVLKAGGVDLLDHLKEGLIQPDVVINVRRINVSELPVTVIDGGLRIEANATLAQLAASPLVSGQTAVLAQAAASAATPAIRNVATAAGNLLQRPRCWYYRHAQFDCLKKGGSMCFAVEGENEHHAVFGPGPCHIVHPSNLAPALLALGATVHLVGSQRASIPLDQFFHLPDKGVTTENVLEPGEVITHLTCRFASKSAFYAVKAKQSFDWPSAFACVAIEAPMGVIERASVWAGAVAPVPWHLPKVEEALRGLKIDDEAGIAAAAALSVVGAKPMRDNASKLALLVTSVKRATLKALGRPVPGFSEIST